MVTVVFGTSGAIGGALAAGIVARGDAGKVFGVSRGRAPHLAGVTPLRADCLDESALAEVATEVGRTGRVDRVIVATGALSIGEGIQPEKSFRHI